MTRPNGIFIHACTCRSTPASSTEHAYTHTHKLECILTGSLDTFFTRGWKCISLGVNLNLIH